MKIVPERRRPLTTGQGIYEAILYLQRLVRANRKNRTFLLGAHESIMLMLFSGGDGALSRDVVERYRLHPSSVSRFLDWLETGGYIISERAAFDRRARSFEFTAKGRGLLEQLTAYNNLLSDEVFGILPAADRSDLARLMDQLATALGAAPDHRRAGEDPLDAPRRRFIAFMGLASREYGTTGLDIYEYQILFELWSRRGPIRVGELIAAAPLELSALSRTVAGLAEQGFVSKRQAPKGTKGVEVTLTSDGREKFEKMHLELAGNFERGCSSLAVRKAGRLLALLTKVVNRDSVQAVSEIIVRTCKKPRDFDRARAFLVESLVRNDNHGKLPEALLPKSSIVILGERDGQMVALTELRKVGKGEAEVRWLICEEQQFEESFVRAAKSHTTMKWRTAGRYGKIPRR